MTSLEKKSFYSFLLLYIISSSIFIVLSAYWYYTAQKNLLASNQYYKLVHVADSISQKIVHAHMKEIELELPDIGDDIVVALIDINNKLKYGSLIKNKLPIKAEYLKLDNCQPRC